MTRVFLAAGVAALAITAPATARPHEDRGGGGQPQAQQRVDRQAARAERVQMRAAPRTERVQQMAAPRMERSQRIAAFERPQRAERMQMRAERPARMERQQMRAERPARMERQQTRIDRVQQARVERQHGRQQVQARQVERQQIREQAQARQVDRQHMRVDRQAMQVDRHQMRADRLASHELNQGGLNGRGYGVGGCPPGLSDKGCMPPGLASQGLTADRIANADAFRASRLAALSFGPRGANRMLAPAQAVRYVGQPLSVVSSALPLAALPMSVQYLYPDTPDYYYRYGDGYLYQVDRGSNLIAALLPLLGGGYMPGSYLPNNYMSSYVPDYYGLNSFYPSSYSGYGYGYGGYNYDNMCNRYANGVVYRVDCMTGYVYDVIPTYAGGYGVGQIIPTDYSYYNVPSQYRSMYYDNNDYGYWYAPGAIYQYDQGSSMITSVAALLSPGFTVGQPLPVGYSTYNVPYAYRTTYYDTPNAWYRYNNGYIYQVDPTTQLVSAIVASILT